MNSHPLKSLIDAEAATAIFSNAGLSVTLARPDCVRHKPGETTLISYVFTNTDGSAGRGYAHWCASTERATQIFDKALTLRPRTSTTGVSTIRVDPHTVFYGFPNDARLRRLRWYITPRKLKRSVPHLAPAGEAMSNRETTVEVLRYKPERRVVARVELVTKQQSRTSLLVRYSTARQAHTLAALASQLRRHGVSTPAPLAQLDGGHVTVDEFIDGTELQAAIHDGKVLTGEFAQALDTFHRTPPLSAKLRSAADDCANAVAGLENLSHWNPGLERRCVGVVDALSRAIPANGSPRVLLHGDLHDKNVLATSTGVAFIDLERVGTGPAEIDLGCLRGNTMALAIRRSGWSADALSHAEASIDLYRSDNPHISDDSLAWHTAIALVDQALLATRQLETRCDTTARLLLDAAMDELRTRASKSSRLRQARVS